jgi:two-component sensor histidine kinase
MSNQTLHIQSRESREKIINRFCCLIAIPSVVCVFIYLYLQVYVLAAATGFVAALFLFFVYLNKKGHFGVSRTTIILITNIGVLFFSVYLGYNSGIYLYLFVAPMLIYLLFDFSEKKLIIIFIFLYLLTFILIYTYQKYFPPLNDKLSPEAIKFIFSFNFCTALVFCFGLVTYFANNNNKYISSLIEQQELLEQEVYLRNRSEELVKKSLNEREVLLAEVHHRVKNNLAIISGLINMQIGNLKEDSSKEIFEETKNRIYAMSLIHNLLYKSKSFSSIDFNQYIKLFCDNISQSYKTRTDITVEQFIDDCDINIKTAIPVALMLNELITNSYKHAFKNQSGTISISLKNSVDKQYIFRISDNGAGMDEKVLSGNSIGMDIIKALAEQIDGKLMYEKNNGSHFTITIPAV